MFKGLAANIRRMNFPLATLLILAIPIAAYFLYYVPSQEEYYIRRNLRILKDLGDQVKSKIENQVTVLDNAARHVARMSGDEKGMAAKESPAGRKNLADIVQGGIESKLRLAPDIELIDASVQFNAPDTQGAEAGHGHSVIHQKNSEYTITHHLRLEGKENWLHYDYKGKFYQKDGSFSLINIHAKSNLNRILTPIVSREIFDDMLAISANGNVLFQLGGTELSAIKLDTLIDREGKKGKLSQYFRVSNMVEARFGRTNYKVFIQPVRFFLEEEKSQADMVEEKAANGHADPQYLEWALCGLVDTGRIRKETHAISYNVILSFILATLLIAISWPFLKIWQMGSKDRLRVADVIFLALSILIGTAVLTFALVDSHFYFTYLKGKDEQLKKFSEQIEEKYHGELLTAAAQLTAFNTIFADSFKDSTRFNSDNKTLKRFSRANIWQDPGLADLSETYPAFDLIVWIDKNGDQIVKWSVENQTTSHINVSSRSYFRKINSDKEDYWLEAIYSWTTGENQVVFSVPFLPPVHNDRTKVFLTDSITVASLVIRLVSLIRPLIPPGFGYCVIDKDGTVLLHSDERRNLRENFIEECDENKTLKSALFTQTVDSTQIKYAGKDYRMRISPLDAKFGWTLVTFYDKEIARTLNLEVITISLVLFVSYAFLFLVVMVLIRILRPRYRGEWIWPDPGLSGSYQQLIAAYIMLGLMFFIWVLNARSFESLIIAVLLPFYAITLTYLKLKRAFFDLEAQKTEQDSARKNFEFLYWKRSTGFFFLLLLLFLMIVFTVANDWLGILLLCAGLILVSLFLLTPQVVMFFQNIRIYTYRLWYLLTVALLLFISAVLPAITFFKIACDQERELFVKFGQLELAKRWFQKNEQVENSLRQIRVNPGSRDSLREKKIALVNSLGHYYDFYFASTIKTEIDTAGDSSEAPEYRENTRFKKFLGWIRPPYNLLSAHTRGLMSQQAANAMWKSSVSAEDSLEFIYTDAGGDTVEITSRVPRVSATWDIWWVSGIMIIFVIIYFLIRFAALRTVLLDFQKTIPITVKSLRKLEIKENLLIIAPVSSGVSKTLMERLEEKKDIELIDLAKYSQTGEGKIQPGLPVFKKNSELPLVIDHFEQIFDPALPGMEIAIWLEKLVHEKDMTVAAITTVDPLQYLDADMFQLQISVKDNPEAEKALAIQKIVNRLAGTLGPFEAVYLHDTPGQDDFEKLLDSFKEKIKAGEPQRLTNSEQKAREELIKVFEEECGLNSFLCKVGQEIVRYVDFAKLTREQLIQEVTTRAYFYYRLMWSFCSARERLALIHLAEDGLVNARNASVVQQLIRRNLVRQAPVAKIMNESFRRFIVANYQPADIAAEGISSDWSNLKGPLMFILLAVVAFLFTTQQDLLNTSITVLTTIAALLPAVAKFLGMFPFQKQMSKGE